MLARFVVLVWLPVLASGCNCVEPVPPGDGGTAGPVSFGPRAPVASWAVPVEGGVFSVADGPLAGVKVTVPAGAWSSPVTLRVSTATVLGVALEGVRAGSDLIDFEAVGGGFAAAPIEIFVPVEAAPTEFPMVFGWDEGLGVLEGMPTLPQAGGVTFLTRHFTSFLALLIAHVQLDRPLGTDFVYGTDDWAMTNRGTWATAGGQCEGQVVSALYYHQAFRRDGGEALVSFGDGPAPGRTSSRISQAFESDDARAYQLAAWVQRSPALSLTLLDDWQAGAQYRDPTLTLKLLAAALYVSKDPQLLVIYRALPDAGWVGHALLAFKKENEDGGYRIDVSDPNYPWRAGTSEDPRQVHFQFADGGAFVPYAGALNATDTTHDFARFVYFGTWGFTDQSTVRAAWSRFDTGQPGELFPEVRYFAAEADTNNPRAELVDGLLRTNPTLSLESTGPTNLEWSTTVYAKDLTWWAQSPLSGGPVTLTLWSGDNALGLLTQAKVDGRWRWLDFRWRTVHYAPPAAQLRLVGSVALPSPARGVAVEGAVAHLAVDSQGYARVDVGNPAQPRLEGTVNVSPHSVGRGVATRDAWAFMGVGSFKILDVPSMIGTRVVGQQGFNADCGRLVLRGNVGFVACGQKSYVNEGMLGIADLTEPGDAGVPRGLSAITWSTSVKDVAVTADGAVAWLLSGGGSVASFSVANPAAPGTSPLGTWGGLNNGGVGSALDLEGNTLYVAAGGLAVLDVSNPMAPALLGQDRYRDVRDVDAVGNTLVAVGGASGVGRVWLYDVSDRTKPTVQASLDLPGLATAVQVVGRRAYVTAAEGTTGALHVVDF